MQEQVIVVEPNGDKAVEFSVDEPGDPASPPRPAAKFVYRGGDQPLQGYTIKRGVGHGGFGEIYYAVSDAGKEVALKLIQRNLDIELRGVRHCLNLKHPNLLGLFDIRQDDRSDTWVVMEYVAGGCLADRMIDYPEGMPLEQALSWFHGICAGVAYLHDRGIVHRDLKPGNIFSDEGLVKVGDYGLSKFVSCSRRSGQTESVGTVHYMAPEVANGRYGKEIDIYALGILLYEILTGRVPFEGESVGEVLMKHLTAQPDVSALAEPYRSVVARALEKDPAKRFGSVSEMLSALPQPAEAPPGTGRIPRSTSSAAGGARPARAPVVEAEAVDEEPILRAVRENWQRLRNWWDRANLNTPARVAIIGVCVIALLGSLQILVPGLVTLLIVYAAYRIVRTVAASNSSATGPVRRASSSPPAGGAAPQNLRQTSAPPRYGPAYARTRVGRRREHRLRTQTAREKAAAALVVKPIGERFTELVGSMLGGALVAMVMCVVMVLLNGYFSDIGVAPEQYAWLVVTSIAGTWGVLITSKFWEGTKGEPGLRRFVLMVVGLLLGAIAFGTAALLMVDLPVDGNSEFLLDFETKMPQGFYDSYGRPRAMAYLACFGLLFLVIRWWFQADPLRRSRLSLKSMIVSMVLAAVVAAILCFPQTWLAMVAATISVSVQLASPWANPRRQARLEVEGGDGNG